MSNKRIVFNILVFILLGCNSIFASELPRYEITATLDAVNHKLTAQQNITFTNNSNTTLNAIYFHIFPHRRYTPQEIKFFYRYAGYFKINPFPEGFQSGDLKILKVSLNSKVLNYRIETSDQTILKIELGQGLKPKESLNINIDFSLDIPHAYGRFGWHKDIFTLTRWYPMLSVLDKEGWHNYPYYLYHHPYFSEAAFYRVRLTVPANQKVAASGQLKEEILNPDGSKTLVLEGAEPLRDFSLGISKSFKVHSLKEGNLMINAYYLEGDEASAGEAARYAQGIIKYYSARFGEYPYPEFNIVPSFLGYGGEQSSSVVFIDTRAYKLPGFLKRYFDFLIAHETGHQWFYNIIGSDEYREMFLDEGMNSYWLLQYLEDKYGKGVKVMVLPKYLKWLVPNYSFRDSTIARYLFLVKNGLDQPIISDLSSFQEPSSIFALTYGKGAAVLEMLKNKIGNEKFLNVVRRYTREFRFKNISLVDFVLICEQESDEDLSGFFKDWLKTNKSLDFSVEAVTASGIVLKNRGTIEIPVTAKIIYKDGSQEIANWDGRGETKTIPIKDKNKIREVQLDSDAALVLDIDRTNNFWPRRFHAQAVPLYFFAYEIPIFSPRESNNFIVGPTLGSSSVGAATSLARPYDNILRLSTDYDFSGKALESKLGYELNHLFGKQNSFGFEIFNRESSEEKEDLLSGKIYWRRELWPASYGLFDVNDHISLYIIKDRKLERTSGITGAEEIRNQRYLKKNETIFGITGFLGRYGPYADPVYGWKLVPTQEFAGHFLGGDNAFWRSSLELDNYRLIIPKKQHKIATKLKLGWGESSDKNLFQLGGPDGLRGYSRKTIEGAHMMLGSLEYRFPLASELKLYFADKVFSLEKIQGVGFFDAGKAWYADFSDSHFKKDLGFGLRLHFATLGFLEKVVLRFDAAWAIKENKEETHFWFGLSQNF